jgi:hypothetical protein
MFFTGSKQQSLEKVIFVAFCRRYNGQTVKTMPEEKIRPSASAAISNKTADLTMEPFLTEQAKLTQTFLLFTTPERDVLR